MLLLKGTLMRRILPYIMAALIGIGFARFYHTQSASVPAPVIGIVSAAIDSVVHIQNSDGSEGSGFAVSPTMVCTARHVVQDLPLPTLTLQNGQTVVATGTLWSYKYDIGLITIGEPLLKPLQFGDSNDLSLGQVVIAIGSTWGRAHMNSVSIGNVQQLNYSGDPSLGLFSHTAIGGPGNSGCPILNTSGQVVGMWVSSQQPMFHYAIPSKQLKDFLCQRR